MHTSGSKKWASVAATIKTIGRNILDSDEII